MLDNTAFLKTYNRVIDSSLGDPKMAESKLIKGLMEDHDHILDALALLEKALKLVEEGRLDGSVIGDFITFLSDFADRCHHGKEELILFPLLERRGMPFHNSPLQVMACEHGMGRYFLRNARRALEGYLGGSKEAFSDVRRYLEYYSELLTDHIDKENNILFRMAEGFIGPEEGVEEAERVEEELGHERLLKKLNGLKGIIESQ